jgi:hypothetical protein
MDGVAADRSRLQRDGPAGCGGGMLNLQCGDRIELFYEDTPDQDTPATTICATVARLLSDREEGMGVEVEDYTACWIEITVDEPCDMDAKQVVLLGTDFQYRLNGRRITIRKMQD